MISVENLRMAAVALEVGDQDPLLRWLGWEGTAPAAVAADRQALLRAAAGCLRVFPLAAPDAPGLHAFGAEVDLAAIAEEPGLPILGTSGIGLDRGTAFAACIGEAVEFMAQVETPDDRARHPSSNRAEVTPVSWPDGAPRRLALDLCLRRAPWRVEIQAPAPLSIGCAAAPEAAAAAMAGALELIERDAVALWWRGGRRGRSVAPEDDAGRQAATLLRRLRGGAGDRTVWLLDITTDIGIPVVAAISLGADGAGFCCGTAARPTTAAAAQRAILELCQNELAHRVVLAKRSERGEAGLNPRDVVHLRRHEAIRLENTAILHPAGPGSSPSLPGDALPAQLRALSLRLKAAGLELQLLDLTRADPGIPVLRAVIPGLACEPSQDVPPRLQQAIAETGGGPGITLGVPLFA